MQENDQKTNPKPLRILFIAGAGRSGSTLVGDVLGQTGSSIHLGELWGMFDYTAASKGGIPCSCGSPFETCDFWSATFETLFGEEWSSRFKNWNFQRNLPHSTKLIWLLFQNKFWFGAHKPLFNAQVEEAVKALKRSLYFICEKEQAEIIIDSSKFGPYAWLLSRDEDVQMIVVHLVRDPRATLYSWVSKPIPMYDRANRQFSLRTRTPIEGIVYWMRANLSAIFLKVMGLPYYRLRYETFVKEPLCAVHNLATFAQKHLFYLEIGAELESQLQDKSLRLHTRHLIGSNPDAKRKVGQIEIKPSGDLKRLIGRGKFYLWTLFFLPWLWWFGYPVLGHGDK